MDGSSEIEKWLQYQLGKPYLSGSTGPDGYDCVGFCIAASVQMGVCRHGVEVPMSLRDFKCRGLSMRVEAMRFLREHAIVFPDYAKLVVHTRFPHLGILVGGYVYHMNSHKVMRVRLDSRRWNIV